MPHSPSVPTLTVTWRGENYGRYDGAHSAFRLYDTVDLDDRAVARIAAAATEAGYAWVASRAAWIAWAADARERFIVGLEALGYAVGHAGCWLGPAADGRSSSVPEAQ